MRKVYDYLNQHISDNSIIGMGSGSTIEGYIPALAEYIHEHNLDVTFVPTSARTEKLLQNHQLTTSLNIQNIDLTIDGADYFTAFLEVIKGLGGALLREKQIGYFSKEIIIIAKDDKKTDSFENLAIPVEINPFLSELTKIQIGEMAQARLTDRSDGDSLFITDNGNYIVDCKFASVDSPESLHHKLNDIPGVIETGIFNRYISEIVSFNNKGFDVYER